MNKTQRDLLSACWKRKIEPTYDSVRGYAYSFKKYDVLSIRQITEVVEKLKTLQ